MLFVFFPLILQYSVCLTRSSQMIDRLWRQWQLANTANTNAYGGGTIPATDSFTDFVANPTGLPPVVTVSISSAVVLVFSLKVCFLLSSLQTSLVTVCGPALLLPT